MSRHLQLVIVILLMVLIMSSVASAVGSVTVKILNNCQGKYFKDIGSYEAAPGKTYLVVGLDIGLQGSNSDSFYVDSSVFQARVGGGTYPYSLATYSLGPLGLTPL